ncbi:hypothetical protein [Sphingobium sp. Sx8-8]|uniref:hypothetical protein n=1 Tax=Sphingobium sp. Sx8-8 TaxID=2933617 RepID=UPI001F5AF59D|nr:hypothetical protein [Sphingobium sp. Sx8-8]
MKSRLLFILFLWTAIGVALLSALAPLGPPSSRLTGSAFNPATTSVVLKARAQSAPLAAQASRPDRDGRMPVMAFAAVWLLPVALMMLGVRRLQPAERLRRPQSAPRPSHLLSHHHARAPPALS